MKISILIVSKNRKKELEITLNKLIQIIDIKDVEILVFLDGCSDNSKELKNNFNEVIWFESQTSVGASMARNILFPKAKGSIFIGLDDDAHILTPNFIQKISLIFLNKPNIGIIAFQEIKGVFNSDIECLNSIDDKEEVGFYTNEFIGCGFSIRKDTYAKTTGFPKWIDIYGEESCVALEVLSLGYDIYYSNTIKVNHRINMIERKRNSQNYFRFQKQLKNTTFYFLVYYPNPIFNIIKLYFHNFKKYGLMNFIYFKLIFKTIFDVLLNFRYVLKFRKPVSKETIKLKRKLQSLYF
jgi:GT2 family glycosyltransferase